MFTVVDVTTGQAANNGVPEEPGDPVLFDTLAEAEQWAADNGYTGPNYRIDEI